MADPSPNITIAISPGELVDRLTILEIKSQRIKDPDKLVNVHLELDKFSRAAKQAIPDSEEMRALHDRLRTINQILWVIEDDIRTLESLSDFGGVFVALARSVYRTNDQRADLKRMINERLDSDLREEKSYTPY